MTTKIERAAQAVACAAATARRAARRAGPDGIAHHAAGRVATRSTPRCTIAVACAVRQTANADDRQRVSRRRSRRPAASAARRRRRPRRAARRRAPRALTTPKLVGRRCVLTRSSALPPPCSSTSARTSSHAQRPTSTLTSRSSDQPSSISIVRTARDRRSQSVSCVSTRSVDRPRLAPEAILGDAAARCSSSARHASRSDGRGPRLVCGSAGGSATSGGDSMPRMLPAHARERLDEVQVRDRSRDTRGGCPAASRRRTAARTRRSSRSSPRCRSTPAPSSKRRRPLVAAGRRDAERRPASSTNDSTCQRIECGRNANGWTSVR